MLVYTAKLFEETPFFIAVNCQKWVGSSKYFFSVNVLNQIHYLKIIYSFQIIMLVEVLNLMCMCGMKKGVQLKEQIQ